MLIANMRSPSPSPNLVLWGWVSPSSVASANTLQLLMRLRRGDDLAAMSKDYPELTAEQLDLVRHLQDRESELHRLYQDMQRVESSKLQLERELTHSLLNQPLG